jgi:hypothetical protein
MKLHLLIVLAAGPVLVTGCAGQSQAQVQPQAASQPAVVIPADPSRDQINAPETNADPTSRKPTIDDPGLQFLRPQ